MPEDDIPIPPCHRTTPLACAHGQDRHYHGAAPWGGGSFGGGGASGSWAPEPEDMGACLDCACSEFVPGT